MQLKTKFSINYKYQFNAIKTRTPINFQYQFNAIKTKKILYSINFKYQFNITTMYFTAAQHCFSLITPQRNVGLRPLLS